MTAKIVVRACCGILFFAFLSFFSDPPAHAETCAKPLKKPDVKIDVKAEPIDYDSGVGLRDLTKQAKAGNVPLASELAYSMGLTKIDWKSDGKFRLQGRPVGNSYCWSVKFVSMTVKQATTVYIAREITPMSCIWREVHDHELKHVDLDEKISLELPKEVSAKIQAAVVGAVMFEDGKTATDYFGKKGQAAMERALQEFSDKRQKLQLSTIDTKEEYARVNAACAKSEWAKVFKQAGFE